MKFSSQKIMIAIWFVTLICSFMTGLIFSGVFSVNGIKQYDAAFGNWATWAGVITGAIAAIGALFAAKFTRENLKFLTHQHDEQQIFQKMQMFENHQNFVLRRLGFIEEQYPVKLLDKISLYENLFRENSLSKVTHSYEESELPQEHILIQATIATHQCYKHLNNMARDIKDADDGLIITKHEDLCEMLKLNLNTDNNIGDVNNCDLKSINILKPYETLDTLASVLNQMRSLSGLKKIDFWAVLKPSYGMKVRFRLFELYYASETYSICKGPHDILTILHIFNSNFEMLSKNIGGEKAFARMNNLTLKLQRNSINLLNEVNLELEVLETELEAIKESSDLGQNVRNVLSDIYVAIPSGSDLKQS